MGPLIHNPRVLASLESRGLRVLDEGALPPDLAGCTVVIRAHGISPGLEEELRRRHAVLADATCPRVKKNQLKARSLSEAGFSLFIAGEKRHGELIGLTAYAPGARAVSSPEDAAEAAAALARENPGARTALIGQTTISGGEYRAAAEAIRAVFPDLETVDSLCPAARERQEALRELCSQVEAVVVAGSRSSSNTRRLLDIARSLGKPAWLAESAGEIGAVTRWKPCSGSELSPAELDQKVQWLLEAGPVCRLTGSEFPKSPVDLITQVEGFYKSIGGRAEREDLGTVYLDRQGIRSSIAHGIGRNKVIAFMAVPDIIVKGVMVDYQRNWKNRGYNTCVIDGPFTIKDEDFIGEVIIEQNQQGRLTCYLHEVEKKSKLRGVFKTGTEPSTPEGASRLIIAKKLAEVKGIPPRVPAPGLLAAELAGCRTLGLSAGASTPDQDIDEIEAALAAL
jgi:4-hydroxy-3-methylbut-2-enyl diphosphate reductase